MDRYLNRRYKLVESQNLDAYLKRNQVKLFFRKLDQIVRQSIKLSEKDGKYVFETFWPMTSSSAVFRIGVPFSEVRIDGVTVDSLVEFKDNKMVHTQMSKGVETIFLREFSDKIVNVTITSGNVVSKRVYARVYER